MKRLIWLPVAGFLLIAGAAVAVAAPSLLTVSPAFTATTDGDVSTASPFRAGGLLEEVLADLVGQDVISQDQADAIVDALEARADEKLAEMEARREEMHQNWELIRGFLEDGVITQAEIDQLPADSPLREVFDSIADDGQVTVDQLRELRPGLGRGLGRGEGRGFGQGFGPGFAPGHGPGFWTDAPDDTDADSDSD